MPNKKKTGDGKLKNLVEIKLAREDLRTKTCLQIDEQRVHYYDNIENAIEILRKLKARAEKVPLFYCGTDVEGKEDDVIQFAIKEGGEISAHVIQRSLLKNDQEFNSALVAFLLKKNVVHIGREVEKDVVELLAKMGIKDERVERVKYVDVETLLRYADSMSRSEEIAYNYVVSASYEYNENRPLTKFGEHLSLRACVEIWLEGKTLDKSRFRMNDWSRADGRSLSSEMILYAAKDAWASLNAFEDACLELDVDLDAFVQQARRNLNLNTRPFIGTDLIQKHRRHLDSGAISDEYGEIRKRIKTLVDEQIIREKTKSMRDEGVGTLSFPEFGLSFSP